MPSKDRHNVIVVYPSVDGVFPIFNIPNYHDGEPEDDAALIARLISEGQYSLPNVAGWKIAPPGHAPLTDGQTWGIVNQNDTYASALRPSDEWLSDRINIERDRRIASGISYGGINFQSDDGSREAVHKYSGVHSMALQLDPADGDLTWGGMLDEPMIWISEDNSQVPMDVNSFGQFTAAMLTHETHHRIAARTLKDMTPIPEDYADDRYWI